jgi:hypothetical protein
MAQQRAGMLTRQAVTAVLSPAACAVGQGRLHWSVVKPRCFLGLLVVKTEVVGCEISELRIYLREKVASEPRLQYIVGSSGQGRVAIRRLDVNDDHRKWVNTTHKHALDVSSGLEEAYLPSDIPHVPLGATVAPGTYQRLFEAFAAECFVALPPGYWTDPQGGVGIWTSGV